MGNPSLQPSIQNNLSGQYTSGSYGTISGDRRFPYPAAMYQNFQNQQPYQIQQNSQNSSYPNSSYSLADRNISNLNPTHPVYVHSSSAPSSQVYPHINTNQAHYLQTHSDSSNVFINVPQPRAASSAPTQPPSSLSSSDAAHTEFLRQVPSSVEPSPPMPVSSVSVNPTPNNQSNCTN